MRPAPVPENELERMLALAALRVEPGLDPILDTIVALAADICGTPISLISIVENDRQWFKSGVGWNETSTPRDLAFCAHAILQPDEVMIVPDSTTDERFSDNPLVTGAPMIRFYAGAPLLTADGHAIGSLCVIDRVTRSLSAVQRKRLAWLADIASARLQAEPQRRALVQLAEAELRAAAVIESALDAIVSSNADGVVVAWNPGAESTFGFTAEEAVGRKLVDLIVPHSLRDAHTKGMRRYQATGEAKVLDRRLELTAIHADGREFPVELTVTEVSTEPRVFTAHLRDITERREAERAIREQNAKLIELDRMRDALIEDVSHELRTPVTSIASLAELMKDDESLPAESRRLLSTVHRSAQRLSRLVNDLLLVAENEAGVLIPQIEKADACAVVREACELARAYAGHRGLEIVFSCTLRKPIEADSDRIAQVVDNLISNAAHATPEGGRIEVRVTAAGAQHWRIEVADRGTGIPPGEIPNLFEPFYRASTATGRPVRGTGLGLPISKAIVEAHGGTIEIASALGEGTTVTVELPRHPSTGNGGSR